MKFWDTEENQDFEYEQMKKELIENMEYLSSMSVEEQTLYKKWDEWNSDLEKTYPQKSTLSLHYDTLWIPEDIYDKEKTLKELDELEPYVEWVDDSEGSTKWTEVRRLIHTMAYTANPGRNLKFNIRDKVTNKILGQVSLGSDVTSLGVRDKYIGWTKEDKFEKGKLRNTAIATTIVSTQPLGYNLLGGKLIAAMATSPVVRDAWKSKYGDRLIAIGTTSLYGIHSQYNGMPHFKTLGESAGKINIKPDDKFYTPWHQWLKENRTEEYNKKVEGKEGVQGPVSGIKQRIMSMIFKEVGIKQSEYNHGFKRGVYLAMMYLNGNEFLRGEIEEDELNMKKKFEEGDEYSIKWWKKKAKKRYIKLLEQDRIKPEVLFYEPIIGMTWEEAKDKYLKEVGR